MKRFLLNLQLIALIILLHAFSQSIYACSCRGIDSPYKFLKESEAVFVGKVIEVTDNLGNQIVDDTKSNFENRYEGERKYRFAVEEWFKGEKTSEIVVSMSLNMCQFGLTKDETYLVYANNTNGIFSTWIFCSRTRNIENAQDDVYFLREFLKNKPEPRIYGSVSLSNWETNTFKYLQGIKIIARSGKKKYITFTDKNGLYRFNKLPNGTYKVLPDLPKTYRLNFYYIKQIKLTSDDFSDFSNYYEFTGKNGYSEFHVDWNNQISGKILDGEGKPLESATVKLIPISEINKITDKPFSENRNERQSLRKVNKETNYREYNISSEKPGKYILAVEVFAPFSDEKNFFRMYYPQTTNPNEAEIIEINEFDRKTFDIHLPKNLVVRFIEGKFLFGDGKSTVDGGWVILNKTTKMEDKANFEYDFQVTRDGSFRFQVFENTTYWIHAEFGEIQTKPIKVEVGQVNNTITIKLPSSNDNQ